MDPIVVDPPGFDLNAAWKECGEFVEQCGGLQHEDGSTNWRAAFGVDPGCCSCPACGQTYWAWGRRQRCVKCAFEYPTNWWSMYSWGAQEGRRRATLGLSWNLDAAYRFDERMKHPYYRYGFEHPVEDAWAECHTQVWRDRIKARFAEGKA